ncbi:MAG: CBS domain-containing protein, partial [Casimicrobiaceae bacterium]
ILIGVWQMFSGNFGGGLWIAFIGWFLDNAASAEVQQVMLQRRLARHTVRQAMSGPGISVAAELTLQDLVDKHILGGGRRCFLVNRGAETIGLMTLHRVKEVARTDWARTTAAQAMLPLEEVKGIEPDAELWPALELMDREGVNQLPVMTGREVVGMLRREDVVTFLRTLRELGT